MKPPGSVLLVVPRRLGDVLLATPVARSLRAACPSCAIDVLVFEGTEATLQRNPDIRQVLTMPARPTLNQHAALARKIFRRYDLALSLVPSDRSTIFSVLAGRSTAGLANAGAKHAWKRLLLGRTVAFDDFDTHTVRMHLALLQPFGVAPRAEVICPWTEEDATIVTSILDAFPAAVPIAILHANPKFQYKKWTPEGWAALAAWLQSRGLRIVLTGGGDAAEMGDVGALAAKVPGALNLAGKLTLPQLSYLLTRARLYCGPDTVVTHMAAAAGTPTVALFGPSNPVKWGPWPKDFPAGRNPWRRVGTQRAGNVLLLQGEAACAPHVPCLLEGCDRHIGSDSDCLKYLPVARVIGAAAEMLDRPAVAAGQDTGQGA
jgi:heptosyltransferase-3